MVAILARKPWVFLRLLLFGWNVLFMISTSPADSVEKYLFYNTNTEKQDPATNGTNRPQKISCPSWPVLGAEDAGEDGVDVAQLEFRIDNTTDFFLRQSLADIRIRQQDFQKVPVFLPHFHGAALDPVVCLFP